MAQKKRKKTGAAKPAPQRKIDRLWVMLPAIFVGILILFFILSVLGDGLWLSLINMRTWLTVLIVAAMVWVFADELRKGLKGIDNKHLSKKQKIVDWVKIGVCLVLVVCFVTVKNGGSEQVTGSEDMPFATISEIAGEGSVGYRQVLHSKEINNYRRWSDLTAPDNVRWNEDANVTRADGSILSGNLILDYHRAANEGIARGIAAEYYIKASHDKSLEVDDDYGAIHADEKAVFINSADIGTTVIIRKGCEVVKAQFIVSPGYDLPVEQWAPTVADSIG